MAYDKSKDKYADFTQNILHDSRNYFTGLIRTPEMKKYEVYQYDAVSFFNTDPEKEFIEGWRLNSTSLECMLFTKDLHWFLQYAARYTTNFPGTKIWLNDRWRACQEQNAYMEKKEKWKREHPDVYFLPDWALKDWDSSFTVIAGVCQKGEWHIREKYSGALQLLIPGGLPKNCHVAA